MIPAGKIIPVLLCVPALYAASLTIPDINGVPRFPLKPEGKASVLFFITSDCPISNSYAPEIQRICSDSRTTAGGRWGLRLDRRRVPQTEEASVPRL